MSALQGGVGGYLGVRDYMEVTLNPRREASGIGVLNASGRKELKA